MKRFLGLVVGVSFILFPLLGYTYVIGCRDGIVRYQKSKRFALTLMSMYRYGLMDGYAACKAGK